MERFRRGDLRFDVRDGGPAGGEPVVLLHGFPQDSTCWRGVEPVLHAAGLRTLAPDQRGYSPGARPRGRRHYTGDQLADDVLALLDQAGLESAHLVGHDWGASVAWTLAGRDPGRVRSLTVLSLPHPAALARALRSSTQGLRSWYVLAFQLPWLPELLVPPVLAGLLVRTGLPRPFAEHDARRMRGPGALTGGLNWYRALPVTKVGTRRSRVPTTYVWGRRDTFLGRAAAEATGTFVRGAYRFVELDGGHWLPQTHPAQVGQYIVQQVRAG